VVEQSIASYGKAHHLALPNISTCCGDHLGLIAATTAACLRPVQASTRTVLAEGGHRAQGARFLFGDILKPGGGAWQVGRSNVPSRSG
jgi:hypothetical protein